MRTPDDSPCWAGDWSAPDAASAIWSQSAVARTVSALPALHPLRLGDGKGTSGRVLAWCGDAEPPATETSASGDEPPHAVGVLTQLSAEPDLSDELSPRAVLSGSVPFMGDLGLAEGIDLLSDLATQLPRDLADALADSVAPTTQVSQEPPTYRQPASGTQRWAGALAQIRKAWLPPVALLPRAGRDLDDPGTQWSTESADFAERHTVHAGDVRLAADLLAPHVMALVLDSVPSDAAVAIYGDALHIWWPYDRPTRLDPGLVIRVVEAATALVDALPTFVLADFPDNSHQVQDRLAGRAAEAAAYRAAREARYAERRRAHGL